MPIKRIDNQIRSNINSITSKLSSEFQNVESWIELAMNIYLDVENYRKQNKILSVSQNRELLHINLYSNIYKVYMAVDLFIKGLTPSGASVIRSTYESLMNIFYLNQASSNLVIVFHKNLANKSLTTTEEQLLKSNNYFSQRIIREELYGPKKINNVTNANRIAMDNFYGLISSVTHHNVIGSYNIISPNIAEIKDKILFTGDLMIWYVSFYSQIFNNFIQKKYKDEFKILYSFSSSISSTLMNIEPNNWTYMSPDKYYQSLP